MLAGSSEACIHPLAIAGFSRSNSLTTSSNDHPERASRPFERSRDGFVIGEGAGVLLLESYDHAKARGALDVDSSAKGKIYAEIVGWGSTSDAHHITSPPASGEGALRAMRAAVDRAGIHPGEIGYINAHATSTKLGDMAEIQSIRSLLSNPSSSSSSANSQINQSVAISSFKGHIGHLLGAAGSVETIWTALAIKHGIAPPTRNLVDLDPGMAQADAVANESGRDTDILNFVTAKGGEVMKGEGKGKGNGMEYALKNSFGFGGTNASLLLRRWEE